MKSLNWNTEMHSEETPFGEKQNKQITNKKAPTLNNNTNPHQPKTLRLFL